MKKKILKWFLLSGLILPVSPVLTNCSLVDLLKNRARQVDGSDWTGRISGNFTNEDDYEVNEEDKIVTYWNMNELVAHDLVVPNYVMWKGEKYKVLLDEKAFKHCNETLSGSVELNDFCDVVPTECFKNDEKITKVIFHVYPTVIGQEAFLNCNSLETICVKLNEDHIDYNWALKLKTVYPSAFDGCALTGRIVFGSSLEKLYSRAFSNCFQITGIDLGMTSITEIPESAFQSCGEVRQVSLPPTIETISDFAFNNCSELINISLPKQDMFIKLGRFAISDCDKFKGFTYKIESFPLSLTLDNGSGGCEGCFCNDFSLEPRDYLTKCTFGTLEAGSMLDKSIFEGCSFQKWTFSTNLYTTIQSNAFAFNRQLKFLDFTSFNVRDNVPEEWEDYFGDPITGIFSYGSEYGTIFVKSGFTAGANFSHWVEWFEAQGLTFDSSSTHTDPTIDHWCFKEQ